MSPAKIHKKAAKTPVLFYTIVVLGLFSLFGLWFFLHPNSPWHSRSIYKVAFEEIGNLQAGNHVNVSGMFKGYVKDFELTDSCVWVEIAVLANIKMPKDSKFRIANAGLMGERVVEILLGKSSDYYSPGARIIGYFDIGSTSIGNLVLDILDEANAISNVLSQTADTLFSDERMEHYKRIEKKAAQLGNRISGVVSKAEKSAMSSVDSLVMAKDRVAAIIDGMNSDFDGMVKNADELEKNFVKLEKSLEGIKNSMSIIAQKLESGNNTISLALDEKHNGELRIQMKKISEDAEKLMEKIKIRGLDLNVDIF
ncbi:MAG: MlaD family protein [Fibromonadales bacterium]|nr:MlaD family protein [Fibromonadales bacterium]